MDSKLPNSTAYIPYCPPKHIMTTDEYSKKIDMLANDADDFATAQYINDIKSLGDNLRDMILYNNDSLPCKNTAYYVTVDGDDNNDGKTPQTAWASLEKVNSYKYCDGDTVYLRRNDVFYGVLKAASGVSYSAYGEGRKPQIRACYDGKTYAAWVMTNIKNVWCLSIPLPDTDIPEIVFNYGSTYGNKKYYFKDLKKNTDFMINTEFAGEPDKDGKLYMYCDEGNPTEVYSEICINMNSRPADTNPTNYAHDISINNIEFVYGRGAFWANFSRNITVSYCVFGWGGGNCTRPGEHLRMGGGGGCWHSCDNFVWDHCYIYQQFDSGVSPQYHWHEEKPSVFRDFITRYCLFETCEYTFEFFNTQPNVTDNGFVNTYFGYNFCRLGGYGHGNKTVDSAYIKSWQNHENYSENFVIEKNVFDRPAARTLDICAKAGNGKSAYMQLPKFKNNIYIEKYKKQFANVNGIYYAFDEKSKSDFVELGFETAAVYKYLK